jgi:hypothetical protein
MMTVDRLANHLKKAGWKAFSAGEFLGVSFDAIGKARIARNNWFVILKSIPILDEAALDTWNDHYAHFWKKAPARLFSAGKYFVLILVVETVAPDAVERFASGDDLGLLEKPEEITGGGGYPMLVLKDRKQILMPKKVVLWEPLRATAFARGTHQAVVDYLDSLPTSRV